LAGLRGVAAVSSGAIPSEECFNDGAAIRCRPIQISNGKIRLAIGFSNGGILGQVEPSLYFTALTLLVHTSTIRLAVFDGGVPKDCLPSGLVRRKRIPGSIGAAVPECQAHGVGVTSAVLYGSLAPGQPLPQPFTSVDHYRVIDTDTANDSQGHYFDVLNRIMNVLRQNNYQFVNLSLGPDLPIEDDEVHVWTASLDDHFSDGRTLVTVAAGNTGENDWDAGNARVQAPSDGVNGAFSRGC
jgi:hypothetical protein